MIQSITLPRTIIAAWLVFTLAFLGCAQPPTTAVYSPPATALVAEDSAFLQDLEQRSFAYFHEQSNPDNGLVADRAPADGRTVGKVASIAAVGFGLSAICVADHHAWIARDSARQRVLVTLRFLRDTLPNEHGFFYHFVDMKTGQRIWKCEVSSIDTALLIAGVLTAREYFRDDPAQREIAELANRIYQRVDWPWMLNGTKTLAMGWHPEKGFTAAHWDEFSEHTLLDLLAIGSPTHPLPAECWQAWRRGPIVTYAGRTYMQCPPLFTHQFPHAWIDFRNQHDRWGNYWQNSVDATLAHRQFCIDLAAQSPEKFGNYSDRLWGITASDSSTGYRGWGGPPTKGPIDPALDGTVVPCAAAGSLPFAPRECLATLRHMHDQYGHQIWGRYGFVDAFNPRTGWVGPDCIGIDVGISLLMAENCRTGRVWQWFMRGPEIQRALNAAGFQPGAQAAGKHILKRDNLDMVSDDMPRNSGLSRFPGQLISLLWLSCVHAEERPVSQICNSKIVALSPIVRLEGSGGVFASFSPDDSMILSADRSELRIWNAKNFKPLTDPIHFEEELRITQFANEGKSVFAVTDKEVSIWNSRTGRRTFLLPIASRPTFPAAINVKGTQIAITVSAQPDETPSPCDVQLFDTSTRKLIHSLHHPDSLVHISFSPDGSRLLTVEAHLHEQFLRVWDLRNDALAFPMLHSGYDGFSMPWMDAHPAAFSPDGRLLAVSDAGFFSVYNAMTGKQKFNSQHPGFDPDASGFDGIIFSPDGESMLAIRNSGVVLWDAGTGRPITSPLPQPGVSSCSLSRDGRKIATPEGIWDLVRGIQLFCFDRGENRIVQFSSDGRRVVTAEDQDQPLRGTLIWAVPDDQKGKSQADK